jgi:NADPH2:quinone reductase
MLADGRTALAQARVADIEPDEVVLVLAAAGGVGSLLVQLALDQGATVLGAAGGARKTDLVAELGAAPWTDPTTTAPSSVRRCSRRPTAGGAP